MPLSCPSCDAFALTGDANNNNSPNLHCPSCNSKTDANLLPLFLITGASGAGKSTLIRHIRPLLPDCFVVGGDLLIDVTNRDRQAFLGRWLRIAYATAQCGRPLVLAGVIEKDEMETHVDRSLVGQIHVIVLSVEEQERVKRLQRRPRWAKHSDEKRSAMIAAHVGLTERLARDADLVVKSGETDVEDAAKEVADWVKKHAVRALPSEAPAG